MGTTVRGSSSKGFRQSHGVGSNKGPVVEDGTTPGGNGEGLSANMKGPGGGMKTDINGPGGGATGLPAGPKATPTARNG